MEREITDRQLQRLADGCEYRSMTMEAREGTDEKIVEGYATVFDRPYVLFETEDYKLIEVVARGAFDGCDMSDVIMQYDHEGRVFARNRNGTLELLVDGVGLNTVANLGGTDLGAQIYKHVHYERRKADGKTAINPAEISGCPNVAGTYGTAIVLPLSADPIKLQVGPASAGDVNSIKVLAESLGLGFAVDANGVMTVGPATSGDQLSVLTLASQLKLPYSEVGEVPSGAEDKHYTATPLVDGLRLRPYPEASDDNSNEALTFLTKGQAYPLVQTRSKWAYLLTSDAAGGWACISDETAEYLKITEV